MQTSSGPAGSSAGGDRPRMTRIPGQALAAGILGGIGVLPPTFLAVIAVALGGLSGDSGPDPWTYLVVGAPVLQAAATVWLLARRGWLPMVLALVPVAVLTGAVIAAGGAEGTTGVLWVLLLLLLPGVAAALAATPRSRQWIADRPRPAPRGR